MMKLGWNCSEDQIWIEEKEEELLRKKLWDPKHLVELDSLECLLFVGAKLNKINVNVANFVLQFRASFLKTKLEKIEARFKRMNSGS